MSAPVSPGGRTGKGARRRAELLDAAEEILQESGHADLSMRAVAAAAGVRLGHLQYYFPARADLVAAVLGRVLERSLERLRPSLTIDVGEMIRALLSEQEDPRSVRLFAEMWALAARDDEVAAAVRAFYRDYQAQVAAVLRARRPDLPGEICDARAQVFTMLIEGAALFRSGIAAHHSATTDTELITVAAALLGPDPSKPPTA